jgi:hypothetical protein
VVGFTLPLPTICDRHCNCTEADRWAARWGKTVEHPNRRPGKLGRYGLPMCMEPGCTKLVVEWGQGHEGHVGLRAT